MGRLTFLLGLVSLFFVAVNCIPSRSDGFRVSICDNLSRFERRSCLAHPVADFEIVCKALGCCFDSSEITESYGAKCFYPDRQKTDPLSYLDASANTYKDALTGIPLGAEASAHVISTDFPLAKGVSTKIKVAEASVKTSAAFSDILGDGIGTSSDATLVEAGIRTNVNVDGLHWVGAGAKVGLSAKTEAKLGLRETSVKILGTGMSIGSENGLEFCIFGSCVSIG